MLMLNYPKERSFVVMLQIFNSSQDKLATVDMHAGEYCGWAHQLPLPAATWLWHYLQTYAKCYNIIFHTYASACPNFTEGNQIIVTSTH